MILVSDDASENDYSSDHGHEPRVGEQEDDNIDMAEQN